MLIIKQELFKLLYKKKGALILVIFCILKMVVSYYSSAGTYVINNVEKGKSDYITYLRKVEGTITPEKEDYINKQIQQYDDVQEKMMGVIESYISEDITMQQYIEAYQKYKGVLDKKDSIAALKSQLDYVKQEPKERFFIYQNGWTYLFSHMQIDWILYFMLLVIISQVFCTEFDTKMDSMNLICVNGRGKLFLSKILVTSLWTILCTLIFNVIELVTALKRYGLSNSSFPIGSLYFFEDQSLHISLGGMLFLAYVIKILASLSFSIIILFSSLLCKKSIRTIFVSLFIIGVPYFIFTNNQLLKFALPMGFIMQEGYIHGIRDLKSGVFQCLNRKEIFIACEKVVIYILVILSICYMINMKKALKFRRWNRKWICLLLCIILTCTSCKQIKNDAFEQVNFTTLNYFFTNERYIVDSCTVPYLLIDKQTNQENLLFHDVFMDDEDYKEIQIEYMTDHYLYYVVMHEYNDYEIKRMDLSTYKEETLYTKLEHSCKGVDFMGIMNKTHEMSDSAKTETMESELDRFWVEDGNLYLVEGEQLYCIDIQSNRHKLIVDGVINGEISVDKPYVYYVDEQYVLHQYNIHTNKDKEIGKKLVLDVMVMDDTVIMGGMDGSIETYNTNSGEFLELQKEGASLVEVTKDAIYYSVNEHEIYSVDYNSKNLKQVYKTDKLIQQFKAINDNKYIIAVIGDDLTAPPEKIELNQYDS